MSETTDPVLDALCTAAPVQDADLNTSAVRDVIALMAVRPRRRYPTRIAVAAAATVATAAAGIWFAGSSPDDPAGSTQVELVAAHFDAVAKQYPLPKVKAMRRFGLRSLPTPRLAISSKSAPGGCRIATKRPLTCSWPDIPGASGGKLNGTEHSTN